MPDYVCSDSKLSLFADDSKLYRTLESPRSQCLLQQDLDGLYKWSLDSNMTLNVSKCKALHISKKKSPSVYRPYRFGSDNLDCASLITDLGISVSCDLQRKYHIGKMIAGANRELGLIKTVCRFITNRHTRKILFCFSVRPQLEYCSNLWSPSTIKYRALIKNVQRRATKFILNYPSRDVSYLDRLKIPGLMPLKYRMEQKDLTLLYKFKMGAIHINFDRYFTTVTCFFVTRNFDENNLKLIFNHKQNYFRDSFFPWVVALWNNSKQDLKDSTSLSCFKRKLHLYFSHKLISYVPP